jgi:hypothetical protein
MKPRVRREQREDPAVAAFLSIIVHDLNARWSDLLAGYARQF